MQGMDGSAALYSRGPKTAVYSPHHAIQRHQSIGMTSAGGGGGQGFSGGYGLFSPGGVMSPFSWDTSTSFRFDFDDLRARSNLLSLSSSIRDADEAAILQRTSEGEELEGAGPSSVVGRSCRNDDDGDKEGDEGKRKRGEGQRQKRKGGTFPGGGGGGPDFEMKRFKLGVLRNLLANFSLEKTIEKYRNLSSKPFTVRPGDYSFDCAVSAHQLKDKLLRLTGSDRIKINDRHFMQKMQKILEHEDQEKTKKGDEERADGEYQRLRKLMQHGVISAKELQDDECLIAAQASSAAAASAAAAAAAAAAVKGRRRGVKNERNRRTAETHSKQSNPRSKLLRSSLRGNNSQSTINNSMTAINRKPEDQSRNTCCHLPAITSHSQSTMNNATSSSFSSFASPSPRRAASYVYQSQHGDFQSGSILSDCKDRPRRQKEADDEPKEKKTEPHCKRDFSKHGGDCTEREGRSSSSLPEVYIVPAAAAGTAAAAAGAAGAGAGSLKRDEHPLIQQMRQEKSVKGLYELAAKISKISF